MGPIAIVESRWWSTGNHSVRNLFESVAAIHYGNPSAFFYDMFADKTSLNTVLHTRAQDKTTEIIYLASHGDENNIGPTANNSVSRAEFRNLIKDANSGAQLNGLFLGTCLTGNVATAKFLLNNSGTNLVWVAGYRESVDWLDGSAIDMVFMSKLAELYVKNEKKRRGKMSCRNMAHEAASQLVNLISGAHSKYGFNIYFQDKDKFTSMFS
ncbi:MAG: hypothetical protein Q8922_05550 [Bacteroidota bacterium]|nr:hypothetical protein [Bacteroidota bacterium]MDP4233132.1 hypothetical protein [Bacteroidota bacterium]MDP4241723.1 hypothetical protein [Bacteroidota bacterium]MDP4287381.1 hypothetical protein [Bacteroidota bacterium]